MGWMTGVQFLIGAGIFLLTTMSTLALGPTQPPIQWVHVPLSLAVKQLGVKLAVHPHLVPRLRKCGAIPPLPNTSYGVVLN
jgi:hypothetical protein